MALADDIAADYTYFDGVEDVTITPANPSGPAAVSGIKALRGPLKWSQIQLLSGTIGLSGGEVSISCWKATMQSLVPKVGDKLTDASGGAYSIVATDLRTLGTRWVLTCKPDL